MATSQWAGLIHFVIQPPEKRFLSAPCPFRGMSQSESIVTQALPALVTRNQAIQASESRDHTGFWLSVLLLCLLPIEGMRFPFNLKPSDLALVLLTLYGLAKALQMRQRLAFPLLPPMWLILISSLVATLVGLARLDSIVAIVQEIYLFTWFILLTNVLKTFPPSDLDRLMKIWSVIACVEAVTTVMGMLRIGPGMFYTRPDRDLRITTDFVRAVGTFDNSNAAAMYLSVSFFALLATSWPFWLRSVLGLWIFAGLFSTGSNGALMSTLVGLMALVLIHSSTKNRRETLLWGAFVGIGAGIVAAILLLSGVSPSLLSEFGFDTRDPLFFQTVGRFSHSLESRLAIIGWASQFYYYHPLGMGPNSYSTIAGSLHNDYAAFLFERGPLGLIGWLWLMGATLLTSLQVARNLLNNYHRWQMLALGAGFLACTVNALSHEISHMRQVWVLMVFLFALGYAYLAQQETCSPGGMEPEIRSD
jgi:hypothetical protein